jgi:hypothetical protein
MFEPKPILSIITPTTGGESLNNLKKTLMRQGPDIIINHFVIWDSMRTVIDRDDQDSYMQGIIKISPSYNIINIELLGEYTNGDARGSAQRSIGLMCANTEYVSFADSDIMFEDNHFKAMLEAIKDKNWAYSRRKIWTRLPDGTYEYLGVDNFESVGEEAKTPYKMVDNSSLIFRRRFGVSAAPLYREITTYNDDREFYQFLMKYAGEPGKTNLVTVNQICPNKLVDFFRNNCTRE